MLTEDNVRHLLAEAATTIKPGPEPEVEAPHRGWRPIVTAVAVVALVAAVITAVSLLHGGNATGPAAPHPSIAPSPTVDVHAGDPSFFLGTDQVPDLAGYPADVATRILQQRGWVVSQRPEPNCRPGTVSNTYPAAGAVIPPGTIVVMSASPQDSRRVRFGCRNSGNSDPFLLWAEGLGPVPKFVSGVQYVDAAAGVRTWLDPVAARDLSNWPHLSDLTTAATTPDVRRTASGLEIVPRAVVAGVGPGCSATAVCQDHSLSIRSGGRQIMSVRYTITSDGSINSVTIRDHRSPSAFGSVPDVVGDSGAYATARLNAWGYLVTPVYRVDCAPNGVVSHVAIDGRNALVAVTTGTGSCDNGPLAPQAGRSTGRTTGAAGALDHYRVTAAQAFLALARGTSAGPAWSDRVAYTVDGRPVRTLTAHQAQRARSWDACPADHGSLRCPLSPLARLRALVQAGAAPRITVPPPYSLCLPAPGTLPSPTDDGSGGVTIMPGRGHDECASVFYVTLGLDGNDRVSSVDLSLPVR